MSSPEFDIDKEAWKLILQGAESFLEDAVNEDPDSPFTDEEFEQILTHATAIVIEMQARNEQ